PCLLNAPSNLILTATRIDRGTQNFGLPHNGLLTLFLDDCHALCLR
ncbi:unnamed protein product, partial [Callosobruchus maculatus]